MKRTRISFAPTLLVSSVEAAAAQAVQPAPKGRTPKVGIARRWKEQRQGRTYFYQQMTDGSLRRVDSDREVRRVLGLSGRQFRKAKKAEQRAARAR